MMYLTDPDDHADTHSYCDPGWELIFKINSKTPLNTKTSTQENKFFQDDLKERISVQHYWMDIL